MEWFKKKKISDERIINIQNKIFKEIYYLILVICSVSILLKIYYFNFDINHILTELVILILGGLYYTFRTVQLGIFSDEVEIHDRTSKWTMTKKNIMFILALVIILAIITGLNSAINYREGTSQSIYYFILVFFVTILINVPVFMLVFVVGHEIARSRSKKVIEKQLEELDGDDNEKY
ncbi:DUF6773 family protein [Ornithinibacillus bavariensis]|uniref:DUF6773 family protein n=1 Tax=Ornithinibacillus bavariensis TaxID=545502 RepID=UPI000ECAA447|nr:hypothetical protein [Ornithinibacillus sp.]